MAQFFKVHPDNPQTRLIRRAVEMLHDQAVVVYPTDSTYALACSIGAKEPLERIRRLRGLDHHHQFTLVCRDLSEIATYAKIDNTAFRLLKTLTPGPYTFVCKATHEVPRRLQHAKRKTIGLRVPDHHIAQALLEALDEPLLSTSLILPDENLPMTDPDHMRERLEHAVDLVIDGGPCGHEPTSVIDLVDGAPSVRRVGKGDVSLFES